MQGRCPNDCCRLRSMRRLVGGAALVFLMALVSSQCANPAPPADSSKAAPPSPGLIPSATPVDPANPAFAPSPLLGEMKPIVSVKELMRDMIDPISDNIFDAVWSETTKKGLIDHRPKTTDDWDKVRVGAVTIAEGVYLLKIPRPFTPPGDVNNSTGPNPPELSPLQIKAKIDKDPVVWIAKIEAVRNVALAALDAVNKKDVNALFEAGGNLDIACEECHLEYWYPGDKATVLRERNIHATIGKPGRENRPGRNSPPGTK